MSRRFGAYVTDEVIGRGTTSTVYRARHALTGASCAVKVLTSTFVDEDTEEIWQNEVNALARLDHPRLVRFQDAGVQNRTPFIVMDYVDGSSVRQLLDACCPMQPGLVRQILLQIADALSYLHDEIQMAHGDIKPEHVLVDSLQLAKLCDFGLARHVLRTFPSKTALDTHPAGGSIPYMAPELLRGGYPTPSTDIYALGILGCQMLTGEIPSACADPHQVYAIALGGGSPLLAHPALPPTYLPLLARALHPVADRRFPTARDLQSALEELA